MRHETPYIRCQLVTRGETCPLDADDLKIQLNIESDDFDEQLEADIIAATVWAENYCGMSFCENEYIQYQTHFCRENEIWFPALDEIDDVKYIDLNNDEQTLDEDDYELLQSTDSKSCLFFNCDQLIPATANRPDAVQISYTTLASTNPIVIKAIKLICGTWFDYRANEQEVKLNEINMGAIRLLNMLKVATL